MTPTLNPETLAVVLIAVLSVARTARLLIWDEFPPAQWLRLRWFVLTGKSKWSKLFECHFCITPWLSLGMAGWLWLAWTPEGPHASWWIINGIWGLSYLGAMAISYDQPGGD